jgi:hypothetical protein
LKLLIDIVYNIILIIITAIISVFFFVCFNLQRDVDRLGEWAVVNAMKINPNKSKAVCFTRAKVKDPLNYSSMDTLIPEANSCKYLGIILRSDLSWADHVNYT